MKTLQEKIDFAVVFAVSHANPNGDPLTGNRPRETYDGYGEISDVCLKRKIRNRLMDFGQRVFVQSDDRSNDGYKNLKERADANPELKKLERIRILLRKPLARAGSMYAALVRYLLLKGKGKAGMAFL